MRHIPNAVDLVAPHGALTALQEQVSDYVDGFYRVGEANLSGSSVGVYLVPLREWHRRSSDRERYRRKIAKALVEHQQRDSRWLAILVDARLADKPAGASREAELVMPRLREGSGVGTIRASVNLLDPNRYHAELLADLVIEPDATLQKVMRQWSEAFSVERVTKRFYEEFRVLRDRLIDALLEHNPDNPALAGRDRKTDKEFDLQLHAFGTRQLGRMLFLWFLQQKRWLGNSAGDGSPDFLFDLFNRKRDQEDTFYSDVIVPLFFDGLGLPLLDAAHKAVEARLGPIPFLGGGLFRAGAHDFEAQLHGLEGDDLDRTRRVVLPDDLFDPALDQPAGSGRKNETQRTVLGLLRGYRFTTQESTPDDQSVDPDPELLGKVFENLYQADERHETGAYYTPREIVHYMCRQALDGYLTERTGISQDDIDWIRDEARDWTISDRRLETTLSEKVHQALGDVKILDPAVGSGAFLLSSMHEIVLLRRGLWQSEHDQFLDRSSPEISDWKRHTATNCLYGVDINPMAVEICHLRLLLSIVVDLEISDYREVPTLPNLDFRVVAGDSLIDRMGERPFIQSLPPPEGVQFDFELTEKIGKLQRNVDKWRDEFAGEGVERKNAARLRDLARKIKAAQVEIARMQLDKEIETAELALAKLKRSAKPTKRALRTTEEHIEGLERLSEGLHDRAPFQKPFLWPVNFHEVMDAGGFDVVLANPPYVRQEKLDPIDQVAYQHAFKDVFTGMADILVYFYDRAVQVLREGGQLAFITSNKYMRAAYGESLREFLPRCLQVRQVIDFGDLPLFSVAAYPAVLVGEKTAEPRPEQNLAVADLVYPVRSQLLSSGLPVNPDNVRLVLDGLPKMLEDHAATEYPQTLLRSSGWILEDPQLVRLFERLMAEGIPLGEFVGNRMFRGIVTGSNDSFVIDRKVSDRLIEQDRKSSELIKPWLRGQDVGRWLPEWAGLYCIHVPWTLPISEYPAVAEHLAKFRSALELRPEVKKGIVPWWAMSRWAADYYPEFDQPKIIWPRNTPPWECRFAYDEDGMYLNDKAYMLPGAGKPLLAYLNSPPCLWMLDKLTTKLRGGYIELKSDTVVGKIPIPKADLALVQADDRELHERASELLGMSRSESDDVWEWFIGRRVYRGELEDLDDD